MKSPHLSHQVGCTRLIGLQGLGPSPFGHLRELVALGLLPGAEGQETLQGAEVLSLEGVVPLVATVQIRQETRRPVPALNVPVSVALRSGRYLVLRVGHDHVVVEGDRVVVDGVLAVVQRRGGRPLRDGRLQPCSSV